MLEKAENRGLCLKPDWLSKLTPDPCGMLHNSRTGLWRMWRPAPRVIPSVSKVHRSVRTRMDNPESAYGPSNLPNDYTVVD